MTLILLRIWAALWLALHLLAYVFPAQSVWGVWPYTVLPPWLGVSVAVLLALLLLPAFNIKIQSIINALWAKIPGKNQSTTWFVGLSLFSMLLFWLLRIRHLGWGDAAILVDGLSFKEAPVIYNWQAPLTVFLHQRLWTYVFDPRLGWGVDTVYAFVSVCCGGIFVFFTLLLAYRLGENALQTALIAGLVLTSGTIQLFFGYVENYTIISLGIMIFLWLGHKVLSNEAPLWTASLALALTNAFHPSTIVLWPAVLYLAWHNFRRGRVWQKTIINLILPPLLVATSVITLMELGNHGLAAFSGDDRPGGGDHIWFVPLTLETPTQWLHYSMFSLAHLLDWGNEMLLLSGFGLFILLAGLIKLIVERGKQWPALWQQALSGASTLWFLAIASAGYLALTWAWNADYGIRKDWDLFSPSAIVYSLLAALILMRLLHKRADLAQATLIILTYSGLHTATWILINTRPIF